MPKNPEYVKPNICPYCTYPCDSAGGIAGDEGYKASSGDLSFCLMCGSPSIFENNMNLKKFDLNTIEDLVERNRLKAIQFRCNEFWEYHPDTDGRRKKYLTIMESNT